MTPGKRSTALIVAGLTVAGWSLVALGRTAAPEDGLVSVEPSPMAEEAPLATQAAAAADAVSEGVEPPITQPSVIHIETPPPEMDGLSATVSRVLTARGFAEVIGGEDASGELSDAVVAVLAARGITLSVAEEAAP